MKRVLLTAVAAAMLFAAPLSAVASGGDQDVAKITCKEFLEDKQNQVLMIMWIDGYLSGKSDNTVLSDAWVEKLGTHLGKYCSSNSAKTIMDAIDAMPSN